jgi:hypothetical protein
MKDHHQTKGSQQDAGGMSRQAPLPLGPGLQADLALLIQQTEHDPSALLPGEVLQLQRLVGNQAVGPLLGGKARSQPSPPPAWMQTLPSPSPKTGAGDIQRKANRTGMPDDLKSRLEGAFGQDFSGVRVHVASQKARDVGARAFAQGTDVHFAPGLYEPTLRRGQKLLAHELSHVVQQRQGIVPFGAIQRSGLHGFYDGIPHSLLIQKLGLASTLQSSYQQRYEQAGDQPAKLKDVNEQLIKDLVDKITAARKGLQSEAAPKGSVEGAEEFGMVPDFARAIQTVAEARDEILGVREVNRESMDYLQANFASKPLDMKGKTQEATGLIPVDQSKGKARRLPKGDFDKCQHAVDHGLEVGIYTKRTGQQIIQYVQGQKSVPSGVKERIKAKLGPHASTVFVCDSKGRPVTADYDLFIIGSKRETQTKGEKATAKKDLGTVTPMQIGTIIDLNIQVALSGYQGGLLFHHGAEQRNEAVTQALGKNALFSPVDVAAHTGGIKRGLQEWSMLDISPQRLKQYIGKLQEKGYDVYANVNWELETTEEHVMKVRLASAYNAFVKTHEDFDEITLTEVPKLGEKIRPYPGKEASMKEKHEVQQRRAKFLFLLKQATKMKLTLQFKDAMAMQAPCKLKSEFSV